MIPIKIAQSDNVSMHLTARAVLWIGFYISVTCKILKKPLIFRKFAGSFDIDVDRAGSIYRNAVSFIMGNCICLLETKYLLNEFKRRFPDAEIYEFANHRNLNEAFVESDKLDIEKVRFVFAGQVKKSKGIGEIIEAVDLLNENGYQEYFEFDLYGSIENKSIENLVSAQKGIIYKGIVSHGDLMMLLSSYDALILPTYHEGEGIPGVIIEAMSCGVIPIVSDWRSVREPIPDKIDLIVEDKNAESLFLAMEKFIKNVDYYRSLSDEMVESSEYYRTDKWGRRFEEIIMSL